MFGVYHDQRLAPCSAQNSPATQHKRKLLGTCNCTATECAPPWQKTHTVVATLCCCCFVSLTLMLTQAHPVLPSHPCLQPIVPLSVNGRQLAPDELAVCELCDSDDEDAAPKWEVRKKQQLEVEV